LGLSSDYEVTTPELMTAGLGVGPGLRPGLPNDHLSAGPKCLQTSPPCPGPGAGSMLAEVKAEDRCAQRPPLPASCQIGRQSHNPSTSGDTRGVPVPRWAPTTQG
jgi:hypothetical protein